MTIWTRFSPRALAVDLASCAFLGGVGDLICQGAVEGRRWDAADAWRWRRAGEPAPEPPAPDPRRLGAITLFSALYVGGFLHFLYRLYPRAVFWVARRAAPPAARARLLDARSLAHAHACGWVDCAHNGALYIPAYFLAVGQLQGDAPADARAALRGAWVETWASCTLFWVPYMSANFALVPAALRVRAMAVGNLAWCVVIDYLAHRGHGAAASAAG